MNLNKRSLIPSHNNTVSDSTFQRWSQIGIRVVVKSAGFDNLILHLWVAYSNGSNFKMVGFQTKKGIAYLCLGLFIYSMALSQITIS
jgi:hypothetical protein